MKTSIQASPDTLWQQLVLGDGWIMEYLPPPAPDCGSERNLSCPSRGMEAFPPACWLWPEHSSTFPHHHVPIQGLAGLVPVADGETFVALRPLMLLLSDWPIKLPLNLSCVALKQTPRSSKHCLRSLPFSLWVSCSPHMVLVFLQGPFIPFFRHKSSQ